VDPHLEKLRNEVAAAMSGLDTEEMLRHPPGKWCVAEILEHLYLTYTGTVKGFGRVLEAGKPLAGKPTWKNRVQAFAVVDFGYMPGGREAPANARPRGTPVEKLLAEIGPVIAKMDEIISRCESRFGKDAKVLDHPFLGPFSAAQWRKFHLVHGLHHVKQIRRLRISDETADGSWSK
jgi:hypothetical protein